MIRLLKHIVFWLALSAMTVSHAQRTSLTIDDLDDEQLVSVIIFIEDEKLMDTAIKRIDQNWKQEFIPMMLENFMFSQSRYMRTKIMNLLQEKTEQKFRNNVNDWYHWLWNEPTYANETYDDFKAFLYKNIDPRFEKYFSGRGETSTIRLDEIRWGGVQQDGIPPLRNPDMVGADEATYMQDDNIVFGIENNGDARAYPKRILAWHEMFVDEIGGEKISGVYCTLCGTVIPYKSGDYNLGTSGFLYRSNKLMYDRRTQSLWNTFMGEPVLGPLVGQGIRLEYVGVVTTTWGEWKKRHPDTKVLSLDTGYTRDYDEGEAYKDYFDTDELMFSTPFSDDRLKNKQEILALRFPASPDEQLAIDTEFLNTHPVFMGKIGLQNFVVLTDSSGANRVYDSAGLIFTDYDQDITVTDRNGETWSITEDMMTSSSGKTLERLPAHRAFWFGWQAAFPETKLIK
ncbi:DUF3179 domain-containing protein [Pseudemcibacter aquimaris]|uniref:DUF3179 domain-containing protein n=1 Tax=Pseudemcibacter aquimaris TaxID=2857064 RepID=UPI0020126D06|nr:DUF3179 domain-containing protein [Pseudemcibacter aquimaris]MCC3862411.1 DUF3179 domain-containing protein [Pseudemcibacter aquimaris]WDU59159.1 DUF3179 domain-containing protein [Pseudemcibacter aquimaris]